MGQAESFMHLVNSYARFTNVYYIARTSRSRLLRRRHWISFFLARYTLIPQEPAFNALVAPIHVTFLFAYFFYSFSRLLEAMIAFKSDISPLFSPPIRNSRDLKKFIPKNSRNASFAFGKNKN